MNPPKKHPRTAAPKTKILNPVGAQLDAETPNLDRVAAEKELNPNVGRPLTRSLTSEEIPEVLLFGKRIAGIRESLKLTQVEFAKRAGIKQSYVSVLVNLRNKGSLPDYATVQRLENLGKIPSGELWTLREEARKARERHRAEAYQDRLKALTDAARLANAAVLHHAYAGPEGQGVMPPQPHNLHQPYHAGYGDPGAQPGPYGPTGLPGDPAPTPVPASLPQPAPIQYPGLTVELEFIVKGLLPDIYLILSHPEYRRKLLETIKDLSNSIRQPPVVSPA